MDPRMEVDRKRKAEDEEQQYQEETPSKRLLLDTDFISNESVENAAELKKENIEPQNAEEPYYDAITESKEETAQTPVDPIEDDQKDPDSTKENDDTESTTEQSAIKTEAAAPTAPLDTLVPFDRLILLHLEATCDENPTNPAAVQVTKENSEIIGM